MQISSSSCSYLEKALAVPSLSGKDQPDAEVANFCSDIDTMLYHVYITVLTPSSNYNLPVSICVSSFFRQLDVVSADSGSFITRHCLMEEDLAPYVLCLPKTAEGRGH